MLHQFRSYAEVRAVALRVFQVGREVCDSSRQIYVGKAKAALIRVFGKFVSPLVP